MKRQVKKELLWLCAAGALSLYFAKRKRAAAIPVLAGAALALVPTETAGFAGHAALITGGSRGLGLALAKELVQEGADVSLLARDEDELLNARRILEELGGGRVHFEVCDVTDPDQLRKAVEACAARFRRLDLLINNAGSITVGPWETMTPADFEAQMKLHAYAPMNAIRFALPYLRRGDSGKRIVNICSMGGRAAVPHMLPYDTSKFALSGFSQGVGAELAPEGISVTTVYPSLMRTGSPIQAVFKGDHEKEFAWFQAGDVLPGFSLSAESAARRILQAARERRWELVPSLIAQARTLAAALFPELLGQLMILAGRWMPEGRSPEYKTGAESRALFDRSPLTRAFVERAHAPERELNQTPKTDAKFNMGLH